MWGESNFFRFEQVPYLEVYFCFALVIVFKATKITFSSHGIFLHVLWCCKLCETFPWTLRNILRNHNLLGKCLERAIRDKNKAFLIFEKIIQIGLIDKAGLRLIAKIFDFGFTMQKLIWEDKINFNIHLITFSTTSLEQIFHLWLENF